MRCSRVVGVLRELDVFVCGLSIDSRSVLDGLQVGRTSVWQNECGCECIRLHMTFGQLSPFAWVAAVHPNFRCYGLRDEAHLGRKRAIGG